MATECGRRIVGMVWEDLTPAKSCRASFSNAITVAMMLDQRHHSPGRHVAPCRQSTARRPDWLT
jgi:hypothetical protein